ncbi:hypothetical protein FHX08_001213 [Rhizobium sp. BK529]|uniref:hypothetical protein n=1 Tax=unclassified Rhizobium TaxID=2613769 RepID=UPI00104467DB|nr:MULTISPECIES: hypothetical protein [unclassified Rhizobium]MBB3590869.1 hypothetical protein [Rhizobium sp. BK529]TCS09176.1 hypothetical protein EV281_1011057 [Rhizobium sp. BK418]
MREQAASALEDDAVLVALSRDLHEAARLAHQRLKSLPDYQTIAEEAAAIEAILQPGEEIADRILCLNAVTSEGIEAREHAGLWKQGDYISAYFGVVL